MKIFPNSIEHVFFEILIPKVKPIAVGIFYRPPNSNDFLNLLSNSFQQIDLNKKEIYLLGDFNINLFQNGKFLLKENQSNQVKDPTSSLISKYKKFCQSFFLTEIIKEPTRTTCNTASLLDHILTNCAEKVSQKGVVDVGLSNHQLIFCTRKIRRTRRNMHNQIQTRSLRNYSAEKLISTLKDIKFPNYHIFSDVNVAYADLTKKISDAIDNVAPIKTLRIKNNSQDWFDSEIAEAIKLREKYFKKFKKSNIHIDYDFYIEAKYNVQKLIKQKKIEFYNAKLTENIGKPKELWKALKNLGLPSKKSPSTNICLTKDNTTIHKINSRLRFLYRQNKYLSFPLRRLLCNAMIQPFFDYACNAWYPNINKKLKTRLQAAQNKCIRFCLKLDDRFRLKSKEFERINWLPVQERISQCAVCNVYKFFSKHSPDYFEELFFLTEETAIRTRSSFQKLKIPRRKTNIGLKSLSYTGPSLWNNLNENLKRSSSINDFKHKIKEFYFEEFKKTKHES